MRILLANFDAQDLVSKDEVLEAVLSLPAAHLEEINVIRYDPSRSIAVSLSHAEGNPAIVSSRGLFYHEKDMFVIVLFSFRCKTEFHHVLCHEIGHYVFLRYLNQDQRDEWMYRVRREEPETVSSYASRNSREDFAETYACCCVDLGRLSLVPTRASFMMKHVFPDGFV